MGITASCPSLARRFQEPSDTDRARRPEGEPERQGRAARATAADLHRRSFRAEAMRRTSRLPCASPALASGGRRMDGLLCQHFARVVSTPGRACPPGSLPASLVVAVRGRRVRVALVRSVHDARGLDVVAVLIPGRRHNHPSATCNRIWEDGREEAEQAQGGGLQQIPRGFPRAGGPG